MVKVENEYKLTPKNGWMVVRPLELEAEKSNLVLLESTQEQMGKGDTRLRILRTSAGYPHEKSGEWIACPYKEGQIVMTFPGSEISKVVQDCSEDAFLLHQGNVVGVWEKV